MSFDIPFNLFDGLSEPFVLGMPSVDHSGGVEVLAKHICLAGVWIPRALPGQHSKGELRHFNLAYADIEPYGRRTADGTSYYGPRVYPLKHFQLVLAGGPRSLFIGLRT